MRSWIAQTNFFVPTWTWTALTVERDLKHHLPLSPQPPLQLLHHQELLQYLELMHQSQQLRPQPLLPSHLRSLKSHHSLHPQVDTILPCLSNSAMPGQSPKAMRSSDWHNTSQNVSDVYEILKALFLQKCASCHTCTISDSRGKGDVLAGSWWLWTWISAFFLDLQALPCHMPAFILAFRARSK